MKQTSQIKSKPAITILCLGDSLTYHQYPAILEEKLNTRGIKNFKVIDKGVVGSNSSDTLEKLDENLQLYKPDIVISMVGINDMGVIKYFENLPFVENNIFFEFKLLRLFSILYGNFKKQNPEIVLHENLDPLELSNNLEAQGNLIEAVNFLKKVLKNKPDNRQILEQLIKLQIKIYNYSEAEDLLRKYLILHKENSFFYETQGFINLKKELYIEAEKYLLNALKINPKNEEILTNLSIVFIKTNQLASAEGLFLKLIEIRPVKVGNYLSLAEIYRKKGAFKYVEEILKKAIEANVKIEIKNKSIIKFAYDHFKINFPEIYKNLTSFLMQKTKLGKGSERIFYELGNYYSLCNDIYNAKSNYFSAIKYGDFNNIKFIELMNLIIRFNKKINLNTKKLIEELKINKYSKHYLKLAGYLVSRQEFLLAEQIFNKLKFTLLQGDFKAREEFYGGLVNLYESEKKYDLAELYKKEKEKFREMFLPYITEYNVKKIYEKLRKRGIRLVLMQYPLKSVELLKKIFRENSDDIIYIDNEKAFTAVMEKSGRASLFDDFFAGDFGHCSVEGNILIAENIVNVLLKENIIY